MARFRDRLSFNTGNVSGTLTQKLAAIEGAGFAQTTMWPNDFFGPFEFVDQNFASAQSSPLRPTCYMMMRSFEGQPPAALQRSLAIAGQMMDQMALFGATTLVQTSNIGAEVDEDWSRAVSEYRQLGELARSRNMRIAFEPLSQGKWINTYDKGWNFIRDVDHPNVGLVIDASHVFLADSDLKGIERIPGDRIFLCEVSDFPGTRLPMREQLRNYRLFPGEGVRPIRDLVERVLATGYAGDFSAEVFNAFYRTQDASVVARRGYEALERLFEKELDD